MSNKIVQRRSISLLGGVLFLSACTSHPQLTTYQNPYDDPQTIMQGIYDANQQVEVPDAFYKIRAVIVPHHLTATRSIAAGILMLKNQTFKKILLLSPDHYGECPTALCTTNSLYHTVFSDVRANRSTVETLLASPVTTLKPALFQKEHGIYAILPYISHYFPEVSVTPVVLSQKPVTTSNDALLHTILSVLDDDTLLIVSSDFSHYLPLSKANTMDEATAEVLFSKDLAGIAKLKNPDQSDCPNCLWTLASIADKEGFYNPSTIFHTNSAILLNNKSIQETTSHFAMVWYQNAPLNGNDLTIGGDVTMTRVKRTPSLNPRMQEYWAGSGVRLVNLEGPLMDTCPPKRLMFNFCNQTNLWEGMLQLATHWGVMNNHMLDQHVVGIEETKRILARHKETLVGDHMVDAGPFRFIAMTALMNPVLDVPLFNIPYQYKQVLAELKNKKPGTLTVVLVHEGREYRALTSDVENAYLQTFIDAGADAVAAAHTHVISDMTLYKGKPIFRGIGNLIFDQPDEVATSTAKAVRLRMIDGHVAFDTKTAR